MEKKLPTEILARLIEVKRDLLAQLHQLAARQKEWVSQGDMMRLLGVLSVKQQLIEELQRIERGLDPFRVQDPESRKWTSEVERQKCRGMAEECESLLADIMDVERHCESALIERRDQVAGRLQGMHHALRASQSYFAPAETRGSQIDLSCES